jgi:hypothetical protein
MPLIKNCAKLKKIILPTFPVPNDFPTCEISSSHSGEYEAQNLPMMEAAYISETSVSIQLRTWQYIPEDSELDFPTSL